MKEVVRKFMLSRARDVFQEKGFANSTVDDIAAAAGVSKPTLYNYFSGKQEIFLAVLEDLHAEVADLIRPYIDDFNGDFRHRLQKMSLDIAQVFFRQQGLVRIMMSERRLIVELLDQCEKSGTERKLPFWKGQIHQVILNFFENARKAGEFDPELNPELIGEIYIGMLSQVNLSQVLGDWGEDEYMNAVKTGVHIFCYGLIEKLPRDSDIREMDSNKGN
ncbi:MAG: TetR/AcrR family transcriptional regulator [Acidobacteriota bacterium]|jgi:AcrR family transcriptional regulator|nr:TetR/AcrR family transcriptional regulator [Acidobacteriota bacterium]